MNEPYSTKFKGASDHHTSQILAAALEVQRNLGYGFLEAVYQSAMCLELTAREIPYRAQFPMPVYYKEKKLECGYRADFLCFDSIIVELKAQAGLTDVDEAQVINYLRASNVSIGLLLNFGTPKLQIKRLVLTEDYRLKS